MMLTQEKPATTDVAPSSDAALSPDLVGLFTELNDLKRVHSSGRTGSIATRLFQAAWVALLDGVDAQALAWQTTRQAMAAARLGDLDAHALIAAGVTPEGAAQIEHDAIVAIVGPLLPSIDAFRAPVCGLRATTREMPCPLFVSALARQPRAGITCPGKPRILLEPAENHAEHCLMVAVYGVLLSSIYDADPGIVFLASLSHHFHNAGMPDAGFTGEELLGAHLHTVMAHHTQACLRQLPPELQSTVEGARRILSDAATPEGRAFHAADVLDRVLQLNQYMRAAALTPQLMLGEMQLVHEGPVKGFHDEVLRQVGLL